MDSTDRENMVITNAVDTIQTGADHIRGSFFNRQRRSLANREAITKFITTRETHRKAQAVESITFWCNVLILKVISSQPWYYFSCALCQCMKGVKKIKNAFFCSSCEAVCPEPILRYGLQVEVTNGISNVVVTLFDEVAERLIKKSAHELLPNWVIEDEPFALPPEINSLQLTFHVMELKSHTYYDEGSYESFACSAIIQLIPGMKFGIVSLDAVGFKTSGVKNLSGLLPQLSAQLNLNTVGHECTNSNDTSLTELLFVVRTHLKLGGQLHNNSEPISLLNCKDPTLTELLYLGRKQDKVNQQSITFACKVLMKTIRPETTWCYLACDGCKSNEGITDVGGAYWCGVCVSICKVPTIRYRLKMDVTNDRTTIAVIFQNTEAEALLKQPSCHLLPHFQEAKDFYQIPPEIQKLSNTYRFLEFQTHTYIDHHEYESFVCNCVLRPGPSTRLGIISSSEFEGAKLLQYYRNGDNNNEKHEVVSAAKGSGKQKRHINESSEEE